MKLLLLLATAIQSPSAMPENAWVCQFSKAYHCTEDGPCSAFAANFSTTMYPAEKWYSHCASGQDGCVAYPARFTTEGQFLIAQVDGMDASAKVDTQHRVVETYTRGRDAFVSYGSCTDTVVPPPIYQRK